MRANPEVTQILRRILRNQDAAPKARKEKVVQVDEPEEVKAPQQMDFELINYDREKRLFGVKLNRVVYLATLVDLPCIIEAMKTLDNFNFYKS